MAILDLSKALMYDFFYNNLKPKYGENIELAYTDTDSFVLDVRTNDFYSDIKEDIQHYDTSDYPIDNVYGIPHHGKKVPGLFKDEQNGKVVTEFVGLRSKMYAMKTAGVGGKVTKRAKGVKRCVPNKKIRFEDYVACVRTNCIIVETQNSFRSKNHVVYTIKQRKITLNPKDDKRVVLANKINTLPWGHYSVTEP